MSFGLHPVKLIRHSVLSRPIVWLLLISAAVRLVALYRIDLFNPDGILYIQEAQQVAYNGLSALGTCYGSTNIFPVLIALVYRLVGDWELSGRFISLLFGTLTVLPIYGILRIFFTPGQAMLGALLFAVNPSFVRLSVDILRGPGYWFFSTLGVYTVLKFQNSTTYSSWGFIFACCYFAIAMGFRIEAVTFIAGTFAYLLLFGSRFGRLKPLLAFSLPAILGIAGLLVYQSVRGSMLIVWPQQYEQLVGLFSHVTTLRDELHALASTPPVGFPIPHFFKELGTIYPWIALGIELNWLARAMFEPVTPFFLFGLFSLQQLKHPQKAYIAMLFFLGMTILFIQQITNWWLDSRMMALALLPGMVIITHGLFQLRTASLNHFPQRGLWWWGGLVAIVFLAALIKVTKYREFPKRVFREIGVFVHQDMDQTQSGHIGQVAGTTEYLMYVNFFASKDNQVAQCTHMDKPWLLNADQADQLAANSDPSFDYYLWSERTDRKDLWSNLNDRFLQVNEWQTPLEGHLVLFRLK